MGPTRPLLVVLLLVVGAGMVPQAVAADDEWPGHCDDAETLTPGAYSGTLSPRDTDSFLVTVPKGDYIEVRVDYDTSNLTELELSDDAFWLDDALARNRENRDRTDGRYSKASVLIGGEDYKGVRTSPEDLPYETRIYAETGDGPLCLGLRAVAGAGDWQLSLSYHDTEPPELVSPQTVSELRENVSSLERRVRNQSTRINSLESRLERRNRTISDLEVRLERRNRTISDLEVRLERKNRTISGLESRISELESQLTNGGVAIRVTVSPENGQRFVEGENALVRAESELADVDRMRVEYGRGTYQLDPSGEAVIPLADTGMQRLTLVYGNTAEAISLNVQRQTRDRQTEQHQPETTTTGTDGSGFGIVGAAVALLGGSILLRRSR